MIPTPAIVVEAATVRRNLARLANYASANSLGLRPHTKTHKSAMLARMQIDHGAIGLTVAKAGEAQVMGKVCGDILMAYPAVDPARCTALAELARDHVIRVGIDSIEAAQSLASAAAAQNVTIGLLIDLDVGLHRTGVQSPRDAVELVGQAQRLKGVRVDGIMFYPGHIKDGSETALRMLGEVNAIVSEAVELFKKTGIDTKVVSGGSTPTAYLSHVVKSMTEFRPGTYIFYDMTGVRGGYAQIEDCAARVAATVVSTAVPDQFIMDCGSKTLTNDLCSTAPQSGHGMVLEYPHATIVKLTEEHAQVECKGTRPKVGERVTVIPNHICPCINLQDRLYWRDGDNPLEPIPVDARGKLS
jgi:D-serine deaminase-like pyridoxal phosphate-dependent protein